jgi:TPR repeat protein
MKDETSGRRGRRVGVVEVCVMRAVRSSEAGGAAALASWLAVSVTGCLGSSSRAVAPHFDEQACLEQALRRDPDVRTLETAPVAFEKACSEGHPEACSALGVMNEMGVGVPANPVRAVALYDRACRSGNVHGCTNLAVARIEGIGGPSDVRLAARLLEPACDRGDARACLYLARLHDVGQGTSQDHALAAWLFEVACDGEEASACVARAESLANAGQRSLASEFYDKACSLGDARACAYDASHVAASRKETRD